MDDDIEIRGVVKNGQVVLEELLNVPDDTEVFIEVNLTEAEPFDPRKNDIAREAVLSFIRDPELRRQFEVEFPAREAS